MVHFLYNNDDDNENVNYNDEDNDNDDNNDDEDDCDDADDEYDDVDDNDNYTMALDDKEINEEGIGDLLHTVKDGETKPRMTDQEMTGGVQVRIGLSSRLEPPSRSPTPREKQKLTAIAIG